MPIRFRCQYCGQLLGIARRKAGTPVNCPTCHNQVKVPASEEAARQPTGAGASAPTSGGQSAPPSKAPPMLFERDDFDELLQPGVSMQRPALPPPVRPPAAPQPETSYDPAPPPTSSSYNPDPLPLPIPVGIVLSPTRLTVVTVVFIVLLAVAFGAGLLVGRFAL